MAYNRTIWRDIEGNLDNQEVIIITGPRRVGKTTTLKHLLEKIDSDNKLFLDLENVINRSIFEKEDYDDIITTLSLRGLDMSKRAYLALDEVQFIKNIPSVVKYLHDHYDIKFILTGSSSYYLKNHFTESLAGRKVLYELLPLSFEEYLTFLEVDINLPPFDPYIVPTEINSALYDILQDHYQTYVSFGGFPPVVLAESAKDKRRILTDIYSSYINYDVKTMSDFKNITDIRNLVSLLAVRVGNRINTSELSSITGLSRVTVDAYIEFLEQTYLIRTIGVESGSTDVRARKGRKLYFVDTGIASINADLSSGQKFENTIAAQLHTLPGNLGYFEDKDGEIDFILHSETSGIAVEVKETPTAADLSSLSRRATKIGVDKSYLIGRHKTERFHAYAWGGEIY